MVYVSVLGFVIVARPSVLLDPDTAACKVWAEEIWRFGRAYYSDETASAADYRLVMPSVPKPFVIGVTLMLRHATASPVALRLFSVAALGFSLWGLCAIWQPRSVAAGLLVVLPAALAPSCIDWAVSAQASTFYLALVVAALVCFDRASEGSPPWSYAGGVALMLAGLTRPGAWLFPVLAAIYLLRRGRLARTHALLGPCIGFLSPVLWGAVDYAFSGDALWSAHTAGPWLPERSLLSAESSNVAGRVGSALIDNYRQLSGEVGYVLLALALAGIVSLVLRSFGSRLLLGFAGAELLVFAVIVATGVGLPAARYIAVLRLTVLVAAGGATSLCCEVAGRKGKALGLVCAGALALLMFFLLGGSARGAIAEYDRLASREMEFTEAAAALSSRVREGDLLFLPLKFIPVVAEMLELYPMAVWFRDADLVFDPDATFAQVASGWLVVSAKRHPNLQDRIRSMVKRPGSAPVVFRQRLRAGLEIYEIRGRRDGSVATGRPPAARGRRP